jgi:predicted methyltransferase
MRVLTLAALLSFTVAPMAAASPLPPADVSAAVAAPGRSAENVKMDASRKPAEILKWAGLRKGMAVLDLFGGNRYWAEIFAPAVGAKGHVTVWEPNQFFGPKDRAAFETFKAANANVTLLNSAMEVPDLPKKAFDFAMLNLNYHDLYWESTDYKIGKMDPDVWLKTLHAAMKPGSTVVVIDHVANPGDTRATVEKFHRIDPATIKADFKRAGFELAGSSDLLRNPADDHTLPVFDAKVRGQTDRVVYKFRTLP